jgi:hypothetical protein
MSGAPRGYGQGENMQTVNEEKRAQIRALMASRGAADAGRISRRGHTRGPASYGQRALWFAHDEQRSGAYNIVSGFTLTGPFDFDRFRAAALDVIERHEVLRTALVMDEHGELWQEVQALPAWTPALIDIAADDTAMAAMRVRAAMQAEAEHVFDLASPPLLRATVLRRGPEQHIVIFNIHHCASDGWSQQLLVAELARAYDVRGGRAVVPPPLPVQYLDHACWERSLMESAAGRSQHA